MSRQLRSVFQPSAPPLSAAVVVACPIEETLWAGGLILTSPRWNWFILSLSGGDNADLASRFWHALDRYDAVGSTADLDDSPEPEPLDPAEVRSTLLAHLPTTDFDVLITHGPQGEYTESLRSEETSQAVTDLWRSGELSARHLLLFSHEDSHRSHLPRPRPDAHLRYPLPDRVVQAKRKVVTTIYGLESESWLARAVASEEAFYHFESAKTLGTWLADRA